MKKITTLILCSCFTALSVSSCAGDNNGTAQKSTVAKKPHKNIPHIIERHNCMADFGLKGKVKSMYIKKYVLSGKEKVLALSTYSTFDSRGNITECKVDKTPNNPAMMYRSWYDANDNDTLTLEYDAEGKQGDKTLRQYDEWGNLLTNRVYHSNGTMWDSQSFKYDDKDSMTEVYSERTMQEGVLRVSGSYKYDAAGQLTEGALEYGGGGIAQQYSKGVNKYNADGRLQESNEYNREDKLTKRSVYEYDNTGKQTALAEYNADGSLIEKWSYTYDAKGNKTAANNYDTKGKLTDYSTAYDYEYDSTGNIIKKTTYFITAGQRVASEIEEITLSYY